jgi:nicotinamide-nucleotide amidase
MIEQEIEQTVQHLAGALTAKRWFIAVAESCTGGWIAKCCTDRAGSSNWFDRGFVTYSNRAKIDMLRVDAAALQLHGAVSEIVAEQMAQGALDSAGVDASLAVTGVAGPDGGTGEKPVGTVWFAWAIRGGGLYSECVRFTGNRDSVRHQSALHALRGMLQMVGDDGPGR